MTRRVLFLLDKSGSMYSVLTDTIGGFNSFVASQIPNGGTMSLYTFSDTCTCVYRNIPVDEVQMLDTRTYVPGGSTALYDAMGKVITENEPFDKSDKSDKSDDLDKSGDLDTTTLVILTDGQENSSRKYTKAHIKDLIRIHKNLKVIYVGVDIDDAEDLGIKNTLEYTPERTPDLFRVLSESVSSTAEPPPRPRLSRMVGSIGPIDSNIQPSTCPMDPIALPSENVSEDIEACVHDPYV